MIFQKKFFFAKIILISKLQSLVFYITFTYSYYILLLIVKLIFDLIMTLKRLAEFARMRIKVVIFIPLFFNHTTACILTFTANFVLQYAHSHSHTRTILMWVHSTTLGKICKLAWFLSNSAKNRLIKLVSEQSFCSIK